TGISTPYDNQDILALFLKHIAIFAPKHCAYGEMPPSETDYLKKYQEMRLSGNNLLSKTQAFKNLAKQREVSERLLTKINDPVLTQLCQLMARIGVFRDKNKAKLG